MLANKKLLNLLLVTVLVAFFGVSSNASTQAISPGFVSDDFNPCGPLNVWTPTTGVGQSITNNTEQLLISVTDDAAQTIWADGTGPVTYNVARMMQPFAGSGLTDTFEIEVKFDSLVTTKYQQQGIVIEQDAGNLLRIEFHFSGNQTILYYGLFLTEGGFGVNKGEVFYPLGDMSSAAALYLKIGRIDATTWTVNYRTDATAYMPTPLTFQQGNFNVSQVGVYAGTTPSGANPAPDHTAIVDYFYNTASPIANEDSGSNTLAVTPSGSGTVELDPPQPQDGYACNADVQITAIPDPDWSFARWEGDLTGSQNPATVTMDGTAKSITALFTPSSAALDLFIYLPLASN